MAGQGRSMVVLTGSGISAESGLATFRGSGGLWEGHRVEDVATPQAWIRAPEIVHRFYNERRRQLMAANVVPNPAHEALARLQSTWQGRFTLVTQNVDDLHERAGSHGVLHMHGELLKVRCTSCGEVIPWQRDHGPESVCESCGRKGDLRPHIVWFGEMPLYMEAIEGALLDADLFVAIGTSGQVYPAAGFVELARRGGAHTVELNLEPSEVAFAFDETFYGPATETVPAFVDRLLGS